MAFTVANLNVNFTEWLSGGWVEYPPPSLGNRDPGVLVHQILLTFGFFTLKPK